MAGRRWAPAPAADGASLEVFGAPLELGGLLIVSSGGITGAALVAFQVFRLLLVFGRHLLPSACLLGVLFCGAAVSVDLGRGVLDPRSLGIGLLAMIGGLAAQALALALLFGLAPPQPHRQQRHDSDDDDHDQDDDYSRHELPIPAAAPG
jgi:hypothetical protein